MRALLLILVAFLSFNNSGYCSLVKDTIPKNKIVSFRYNYDFTSYDSVGIDTTLRRFQIYNPAFNNLASNTYLGNLCLPFISVLQSDLEEYSDMLFSQYASYTMHYPESNLYYRARQPFTEVNYFSGGPKARQTQKLGIIHTQNVNKNLNVGFLVDLNYADGQYLNQRGKSNAITLFSNYQRNRYSFNTNFNLNTVKNQENGGMFRDSIYEQNNQEASTLPVNLSSAITSIKNQSFFINQRFYLTGSYKEDSTRKSGSWNDVISIIHQFKYERNIRTFSDDLNITKPYKLENTEVLITDGDFYKKILGKDYALIDTTKTRDSLYFRRFENVLQVAINTNQWLKIPAELRFGLKNQLDKYNYGMDADSVFVNKADSTKRLYTRPGNKQFNTAFVASLSNRFTKKVNWGASAEYYFTGYKVGNLKLRGDFESIILKNYVFKLSGEIATTRPGYFLDEYSSNNYAWSNDFSNQKLVKIKAGIYLKKFKLAIEAQSYNYKNFVYFDIIAKPVGVSEAFTVNSITISKLIDWGIFHSEIRATFQKSGNENAISLPYFSGFNSTFLEFNLFKRVLKLQLGYDLFYNSAFYANAYMPATGMFYNQRLIKIGDYPYSDMFFNIKLKRTRFTIKYEHFTSLLQGGRGYFAPHYPITPHVLNFGLSWTFYD